MKQYFKTLVVLVIVTLGIVSCEKNSTPEPEQVRIDLAFKSHTAISESQISISGSYLLWTPSAVVKEAGVAYREIDATEYTFVPSTTATSPFTTVVGGLKTEVKYYYKLYAKIADSIYYTTEERSFTLEGGVTPPVTGVELSVDSQTADSPTQMTIAGFYTLASESTVVTEVGAAYRTESQTGYTFVAASSAASPFTVSLKGLTTNVKYYYKLYAKASGNTYYTADELSFTLTSGVTPDPSATYQPHVGWAELPADNANDDYHYAFHLCAGKERAAAGNIMRNYAVCYSAKYHCPVWVAAPMHSCYTGDSGRSGSYSQDPDIPSSIQQYNKTYGGGCNKGHMLGSSDRTVSSATNRQVFYYSNIAPQYSSTFNTGGGAWNNLEEMVDGLWCTDTLYQVIGCYFDKYTDAYGITATPKTADCGGQDTGIPTMFYKVLLRTKSGRSGKSVRTCSASELQCVAFVMRHTMPKGHEPEARDLMSVADLEKITGFTYFTNVPNAPKNTFSASEWGL